MTFDFDPTLVASKLLSLIVSVQKYSIGMRINPIVPSCVLCMYV